MLCIYTVSRKYLKGFLRVIQLIRFPVFKFSKGNKFVKNVGGIMVLVLSLLSEGALYLYNVS